MFRVRYAEKQKVRKQRERERECTKIQWKNELLKNVCWK